MSDRAKCPPQNVPVRNYSGPAARNHSAVSLLRARRRIDLRTCARCGLTDLLALQRFDNGTPMIGTPMIGTCCRRCARIACGLPPTERDHVIGRHNSAVTLTIDANDHARLTALQSLWPNATLRNPYHDPLLASAALLHRIADLATVDDDALTLRYVVVLQPVSIIGGPIIGETQRLALRLERASAYLQRAFGRRWHTHIEEDTP